MADNCCRRDVNGGKLVPKGRDLSIVCPDCGLQTHRDGWSQVCVCNRVTEEDGEIVNRELEKE